MSLLLTASSGPPLGVAAITEGRDTAAGAGKNSVFGVAGITEGHDTAAGVGKDSVFGAAGITEGHDIAAGVGKNSVFGVAGITEAHDTAAGVGTNKVFGIAGVAEGADIVVASGTASGSGEIDGTSAIVERPDAVVASGNALPPAGGPVSVPGGSSRRFRLTPDQLALIKELYAAHMGGIRVQSTLRLKPKFEKILEVIEERPVVRFDAELEYERALERLRFARRPVQMPKAKATPARNEDDEVALAVWALLNGASTPPTETIEERQALQAMFGILMRIH